MSTIPRTPENIFLAVLGLFGLLSFLCFFPEVQPAARINMTVDRTAALQIAEEHLRDLGTSLRTYTHRNIGFDAENRYAAYFKSINATEAFVAQTQAHSAPYYWIVTFTDPVAGDSYELHISTQGQVFGCMRNPPLDLAGERLTRAEAEDLARTSLDGIMDIDWPAFARIDAKTVDLEKRTDHTFTWHTHNPTVGTARLRITATVMGNELSSWSRSVEFPREFLDDYQAYLNVSNLIAAARVILAILLWIFALFIFALRFRASEVSIRNGLIVASLLIGGFVFFWVDTLPYLEQFVVNDSAQINHVFQYINIGLQTLFTSLGLFFVWISGESHTRDLWPQKLKAIDALFARYALFPDLGRAILRGFALGFIQLGIWFAIIYAFKDSSAIWFTVSQTESQLLSAFSPHYYLPPLGLLAYVGSSSLLAGGFAYLFSISLLKKMTKRTAIAIAVPWLVFSTLFTDITVIFPQWYMVGAGILIGLFSFLFYLRYDLATIVTGGFVFGSLPLIHMYLSQSGTMFVFSAVLGLIIIGGLLIFGLVARIKGVPLDDAVIEPVYARNISERQRLKLELEIARRAQLQMLPQRLPEARGLDIAALSEPARQVGGDYYDFFHLNDDLLGFAIGDVSGKGMPAALYMTLLKGSLQSRASADTSPRSLLSHINRTFYRSAERITFVTLLYGVIDLKAGKLTFARAGHNPALIFRQHINEIHFLKPPGLGIGLEKGDVFDRTLAEETFSLQEGDTIVLFTDGLTEARNPENEEYGEERLTRLITSQPFHSADELLDRIRSGYNAFTGRAVQHDDLTCLVIRVSSSEFRISSGSA